MEMNFNIVKKTYCCKFSCVCSVVRNAIVISWLLHARAKTKTSRNSKKKFAFWWESEQICWPMQIWRSQTVFNQLSAFVTFLGTNFAIESLGKFRYNLLKSITIISKSEKLRESRPWRIKIIKIHCKSIRCYRPSIYFSWFAVVRSTHRGISNVILRQLKYVPIVEPIWMRHTVDDDKK